MPQFTEMRRPALWDDDRLSRGEQPRRRPGAPCTVVVGYDGSQASQRALRRAAESAGSGGSVVVVTAAPPANPLAFEPCTGSPVAEPSRLLEEAAAELTRLGVHVSTRVEESEPAEALAQAARQVNAALIVVGARGDNYLARELRGSIGATLVARAPCDLLIAR